MKHVTLHIEAPDGEQTASLDDELTIGRTDISDLVLGDQGLSRKNTTFFRDGDDILVVDEGSLNGTFLNGQPVNGPPQHLRDGDTVKIGSNTHIRVAIDGGARESEYQKTMSGGKLPAIGESQPPSIITRDPKPRTKDRGVPTLVIGSVILVFLIVFGALLALFLGSRSQGTTTSVPSQGAPQIMSSSVIPMHVIDPLGGEDEDDLDDLIASWETQEKEIDAKSLSDVSVAPADTADSDLNVTAAFLADRQAKALEPRNAETGIRPAGLAVPKELYGDGVIKQKLKLKQMNDTGYHQPMDFADLAQKRLSKDLIEMPMATQTFYLDVGGSASDGPFTSFTFEAGNAEIPQGSSKYQVLSQLASNFAGQRYDLSNPADRKQMRVRLLRMFNPHAKPILEEIAAAYFQKYNRPLRVTSLTRSMDYQIGLNATNVNSFKVKGEGSLPPHTSGCAFDLARKHMTADEQNFVMKKLAEMEDANKLDALIEYGDNACFHIFIYWDGVPPKT